MRDWYGNLGGPLAGHDFTYELPEAACVGVRAGSLGTVWGRWLSPSGLSGSDGTRLDFR
jgi:hypothetical protein